MKYTTPTLYTLPRRFDVSKSSKYKINGMKVLCKISFHSLPFKIILKLQEIPLVVKCNFGYAVSESIQKLLGLLWSFWVFQKLEQTYKFYVLIKIIDEVFPFPDTSSEEPIIFVGLIYLFVLSRYLILLYSVSMKCKLFVILTISFLAMFKWVLSHKEIFNKSIIPELRKSFTKLIIICIKLRGIDRLIFKFVKNHNTASCKMEKKSCLFCSSSKRTSFLVSSLDVVSEEVLMASCS